MFEGKEIPVGVEGNTLTEAWGDLEVLGKGTDE